MLARPLLGQQGEDPVASVWLEVLVNARLRSHAAVSDEHRPLQSEATRSLPTRAAAAEGSDASRETPRKRPAAPRRVANAKVKFPN